ncbi:MAG: 2-dehydropantoate 2-reductase [Candidatus Thermoplasmatota archaeon]|nr:2-dehydropantoate 2-reductase [Candidatus Thermoplasmatota archaeon]
MKIGIVGPGAIGTFLAGVLGKHNEVDLLGRRPLDIETIEISGKTRVETDINYTDSISSLSDKKLIVICTKSFDTKEAVASLSNHLSSKALVLSLQNGLNNEGIISGFVGKERTIGGITNNGVTYMEPGKVKHAGMGKTVIGLYPKGTSEEVEKIVRVFRNAGLETTLSENILVKLWEKAVINSGINPITAVLGIKNGVLIEDRYLTRLLEETVRESAAVAENYVDLDKKKVLDETKEVARQTSENLSSMLQDVKNESRTEVDQINGAIIEKALDKEVSTPVNKVLYKLVKGLENKYL